MTDNETFCSICGHLITTHDIAARIDGGLIDFEARDDGGLYRARRLARELQDTDSQ